MSSWGNYINTKKDQKDNQKYVVCTTPGCDGWTWQSRWISKCKKCWAPFDWDQVDQAQGQQPKPAQQWGSQPWDSKADSSYSQPDQGAGRRWGNDKSKYEKHEKDYDKDEPKPYEDPLKDIKEDWDSFKNLFAELGEDNLPAGLADVYKNLHDKISPDPPEPTPAMQFKKAKSDAQWARQEYLKIQLKAQGHRQKCVQYKQWLDEEQAKLDQAIADLEPARQWDEQARQQLEDLIWRQEREQLQRDAQEMDNGGPPGVAKKRAHRLDDPEPDEFMDGEDSDDIQDPQEFLLLQAQIKSQQKMQEQILKYRQIRTEHRRARESLHSLRATRAKAHRDAIAPYPSGGRPDGAPSENDKESIEQRRIDMEEQIKGALAAASASEGSFPGPSEDPASEAGARWMATK